MPWQEGREWTLVFIVKKIEVKLKCQENSKKSFSKRNGVVEVEENDFNDTLVHDVDAHKVNLHTCSSFFCMR